MIPDHANPHEKPTKVSPAPQLTCKCGNYLVRHDPNDELTVDFWARVGWRCTSCGKYNGRGAV